MHQLLFCVCLNISLPAPALSKRRRRRRRRCWWLEMDCCQTNASAEEVNLRAGGWGKNSPDEGYIYAARMHVSRLYSTCRCLVTKSDFPARFSYHMLFINKCNIRGKSKFRNLVGFPGCQYVLQRKKTTSNATVGICLALSFFEKQTLEWECTDEESSFRNLLSDSEL